MALIEDVKLPDIGDFSDVEIIEILVAPGDRVEPEQSLVTLESDKATIEIPSPLGGLVKALKVKVGDKVSEGDSLLSLETGEMASTATPTAEEPPPAQDSPLQALQPDDAPARAPAAVEEVRLPDIGDFSGIPVIEVLVSAGDIPRHRG